MVSFTPPNPSFKPQNLLSKPNSSERLNRNHDMDHLGDAAPFLSLQFGVRCCVVQSLTALVWSCLNAGIHFLYVSVRLQNCIHMYAYAF